MKVAVITKIDAGCAGTEQYDCFVVDLPLETICKGGGVFSDAAYKATSIQEYAKEHAESYGYYQSDDGLFYDEDGEEQSEPEAIIVGIYDPEVHDDYRMGGGSFLEEDGVREAYEVYKNR